MYKDQGNALGPTFHHILEPCKGGLRSRAKITWTLRLTYVKYQPLFQYSFFAVILWSRHVHKYLTVQLIFARRLNAVWSPRPEVAVCLPAVSLHLLIVGSGVRFTGRGGTDSSDARRFRGSFVRSDQSCNPPFWNFGNQGLSGNQQRQNKSVDATARSPVVRPASCPPTHHL